MEMVSIIVPVFNVIDYLDKCIVSLIEQTYSNIEIILVDDGSTDGSGDLCDKYALKDNRIIVIHKKNGGQSSARNAGVHKSKGKYISFIDGDDYISPYFIEYLYNSLQTSNVNIVACDYHWVNNMGEKPSALKLVYNSRIIPVHDAMLEIIDNGIIKTVVWDKLYRREVVVDGAFEEGIKNEDIMWTAKVIGNEKEILYIDAKLYYYVQRNGSETHSEFSYRDIDEFEEKCKRQLYIQDRFPDLSDKSGVNMIATMVTTTQKVLRFTNGKERRKCLERIINLEKTYSKKWNFKITGTIIQQITRKFTMKYPILAGFLRNCLNVDYE